MDINLSTREIKYVLEVAEERSMTRAAEKLFIAQPSLSQTIIKIEDKLGIKLFARNKGRITLTSEGERFVKMGEQILRATKNFETEILDLPNFQGNAAVNYTDRETPWTRIIEHKWFEFGLDENGAPLPRTVITREYSSEWKPGDEPYYPVNDAPNSALYRKYRTLAETESRVLFGGRLGEYRYYDMDQVISSALDASRRYLGRAEG